MALSTYPGSVPSFPSHKNLLDDLEADHINFIQRELTAVAGIVGINPHVYNNLESAAISTTGAQMRRIDYGTVANRLDGVERGSSRHCFRADTSEVFLSPSPSLTWSTVAFTSPGSSKDPFDMFNGVGVTLRKAGFWVFQATAFIIMTGELDSDNIGTYQTAIDTNGQWTDGVSRVYHDATTGALAMNMTKFGFFAGGTQVTLSAAHNALATQRISSASISGFLVRENV